MNSTEIKRLKYACYTSSLSMSVVVNLSPILFLTFRTLYGISYSLLGLLVLINFLTQLLIDLLLSFFSHKFDIPKTIKIMPALTAIGLLIFAVWPFLFPKSVYFGLVLGTVIFSAACGFGEVLISPVVAALPAKEPDREMSKLHSVYAWGVVFVVIISTGFLSLFGSRNWQWLALVFTILPIISLILFSGAKIPKLETEQKSTGGFLFFKNKGFWLCVIAIFLGGAAECTMAQWSSSYLEQALGIPKVWGDIFGVALFAVMLGLGRSIYAKIGKNIGKVLVLGAAGATICYFVAAVSNIPVVGLVACAFTGFCTSILWPGNLVLASDRFPSGGVFIYAVMAAGGDFGASVGPQLVGIVTDLTIASPSAAEFAQNMHLAPEQLGMKLGMLVGMLFPLAAIFLCNYNSKKTK